MLLILSTFLFTIISPLKQLEKAKDAKRAHDLTQVRNALDTYYNDHNCYPATLTSLTGSKTYLKEIPQDPDSGAYYQYEADSSNCPQWNILFAKISASSNLHSPCPLDQLSNCVPQGYSSNNYTCLLSGNVDCSYITRSTLPTPIIPTPTPTVPPSNITLTPPPTSPFPTPTPTIIPLPTIPACSPLYSCTSSGPNTRCNAVNQSYVNSHPNSVYYCNGNCNGACTIQ